jgi:hypothetical protein
MDPTEIPLRAWRDGRARLDAAAWRWARPFWRRRWCPSNERLFVASPLVAHPLGFITAGRAELLVRDFPLATEAIVARAEQALAGRVRLLGHPEVTLSEPIAWSRDAITGRVWPDGHGKLIDYRSGANGDAKWIWELNRCQELPLLALAWRLSGEDRFAETAVTRMLSWIDACAPARGIAWGNGFEAGLRAISFALAYDCLRGSTSLDEPAARSILRSLWQHTRFIGSDLSRASSANNHLVGELAGIATVGLLAPELRASPVLRSRALSGLAAATDRQILPDGTGAEQSFAYFLFVCDLLVLVSALAESRSVAVPPGIVAGLGRALRAIEAQVQEREPDPSYGDADDGRAFQLDAAPGRDARAVAAAVISCLGEAAPSPDPTAVLLFGPRPARGEVVLGRDALLADSGIVVLRRGRARITFEAGPLGFVSLAAHGHADALQVTLTDDAVEIVGDPGTGSYTADPQRRTAFRGTAFHATVVVDGLDQAEQVGPFLWRRHYRARLLAADLARGFAVGQHDGFTRLGDPVVHRRAVLALADGSILVLDRLQAAGSHRYAQTWPLAPPLEVASRGAVVEATLEGAPRLTLAFAAAAPAVVRLQHGARDPLAGWWSRRLEASEPSWTVTQEIECAGGTTLAALLLVSHGRVVGDPRLTLSAEGSMTLAGFVSDETPYQVRFDLGRVDLPIEVVTEASRVA